MLKPLRTLFRQGLAGRPSWPRSARSLRSIRPVSGPVLGIFLLVLQFAAPLAGQAAGGDWIEICSECGIIEVQVDFGDSPNRTKQPGYPACTLCSFCAISTVAQATTQVSQAICFETKTLARKPGKGEFVTQYSAHFWPVRRGPPAVKKTQTHHSSQAALMSNQWKGEAS